MRGGGQQDLVEKSRVVLKPLFQDLAEGTHGDACSSLFRWWKKRAMMAIGRPRSTMNAAKDYQPNILSYCR